MRMEGSKASSTDGVLMTALERGKRSYIVVRSSLEEGEKEEEGPLSWFSLKDAVVKRREGGKVRLAALRRERGRKRLAGPTKNNPTL